jgi:hypothetical protein
VKSRAVTYAVGYVSTASQPALAPPARNRPAVEKGLVWHLRFFSRSNLRQSRAFMAARPAREHQRHRRDDPGGAALISYSRRSTSGHPVAASASSAGRPQRPPRLPSPTPRVNVAAGSSDCPSPFARPQAVKIAAPLLPDRHATRPAPPDVSLRLVNGRFDLLRDGLTNEQTPPLLVISLDTAKFHVSGSQQARRPDLPTGRRSLAARAASPSPVSRPSLARRRPLTAQARRRWRNRRGSHHLAALRPVILDSTSAPEAPATEAVRFAGDQGERADSKDRASADLIRPVSTTSRADRVDGPLACNQAA